MRCPRCLKDIDESIEQCICGFKFDRVTATQLPDWFAGVKTVLETAYLAATTPWQQSGMNRTFEDWMRLRLPNVAAVNRSGTYLDIGCANGYLLECILVWTQLKGLKIEPYGLDYSIALVELARQRLPTYAHNIYVGNVWDWQPPQRFDYVRSNLEYVPRNCRQLSIERLLSEFVKEDGKLIISQYRSRRDDLTQGWIENDLQEWGFESVETCSGYDENGLELCRAVTLKSRSNY